MTSEPNFVLRGGSWLYRPPLAQVVYRSSSAPENHSFNFGIRLIRVVYFLQQIAEVKNGK